jgi:hypothetical protein
LPRLVVHLLKGRRRRGAGIVEQDVGAAPLRDGRIDQPLAVGGPADVGYVSEHLALRGLANLIRRPFEMFLAPGADGDLRALGGELFGGGAAEPVAAARDDGDLSGETEIEHERLLLVVLFAATLRTAS